MIRSRKKSLFLIVTALLFVIVACCLPFIKLPQSQFVMADEIEILPESDPSTTPVDPNADGNFVLPNLFLPVSSVSIGAVAANAHYYGVIDFQFKIFGSNYLVFYDASAYSGSANAYLRDGNFVSPLVYNSIAYSGSTWTALNSVNVSSLGGNSYAGYECDIDPSTTSDYYFVITSSLAYQVPLYFQFSVGSGFDINYFNGNVYSVTYNLQTSNFPTFFTARYTDNSVYYLYTIDIQCFNGSHLKVYIPVVKFVIDWRMNGLPYTVYTQGAVSEDLNYNIGYNTGYYAGQSAGESTGYNSGYNTGYNSGYSAGDSAGYTRGILDANDYSFVGLIGATVDAPIKALTGLLNFEILGVNLSAFVYGLFSITLVIIVIKYIKR